MTTFTSPLLLSDEEILKMGIKPHDVEVFRRRQYQFSFGIHTWYKALEKHTFRSEIFDLSIGEARVICARHRHQEHDRAYLLSLQKKLDDKLKLFPNGAFIKLDTRSPKDVPVYAFDNPQVKKLIDDEMDCLSESQIADSDERTAAFVRATNKYMRVTTGAEALDLLCKSYRVSEDLDKALEYGEELFVSKVVIREWLNEVPNHPEMEFRGFVYKNRLNALTQYFSFIQFPYLIKNKDAIASRICSFFESIKHLIQHESYVIDFFVLKDRVAVIELNPFHNGAGTGLFSWKKDRQLFMEGPFEFKVVDARAPDFKREEVVPLIWDKYMTEKCTKRTGRRKVTKYAPVVLLVAYTLWQSLRMVR